METVEAFDKKIVLLEEKLSTIKGTKTAVYTRVVGYYRDVNNFNDGKREEYGQRKNFILGELEDREK